MEDITGRQAPSSSLESELTERGYEIALLRETTAAIGSELDLERLFRLIGERAREVIGAETLLVPIISDDGTEYTYRAAAGKNAEEIVGETLPISVGVCGWVWRHKRPWWRGVLDELPTRERTRWEKEAGTVLLVPLIGRHQFLGGLAAINKEGGGEFSERDLHLLELLAGQMAIAIENAMAVEALDHARRAAQNYQTELQRLNQRLTAANEELERLSLYDQLTGLPNRTLFRDRLQHELNLAITQRTPVAVMVIDLDHFQDINDALGHENGDQLLKTVASRLAAALGPVDTLSRMAGDEFAILLPNADSAAAECRARALLQSIKQPMRLGEQDVHVSATIGIAAYPQHGLSIYTLMRHADNAMANAKRLAHGVHVFEYSEDTDAPGRLRITRDLQSALANHEFELFFQPKLALGTGNIVGVEALARWPDKLHGYVPTEMFVTALQQTGLIGPFSYWVLETALAQQARWQQYGWDLKMAVNLPVTVFLEQGFARELERLLTKYHVQDGLVLEITENIFLSDHDHLSRLLHELKHHSVTFSIDDFGTGHSSLSRLRKLPVTELKIDRSFVMGIGHSKDDDVIVRSTIDLAHNLGLRVCAEGVENAEVMQQLYDWRCDYVQGNYISKPLPILQLEAFLNSSAAVPGRGTRRPIPRREKTS